uniref:DEAD domain-containing protein n=1 Tax=Steinernema glaseri TaxID=37863 RepID=A0A1I7ZVD4_9BILA
MQTWREATKFAKLCNLRVVCVYGGVGISEQIADLKRGAEIVVCTPGRMIDMLAANNDQTFFMEGSQTCVEPLISFWTRQIECSTWVSSPK